ncbi:MAG: hypothetical protein QM771_16985 [Nitrospira sp.]
MPKLISVKQQEGHDARATAYIKAYMLFPAGILGLISMLGGVGGLGYQLIATDTYSWATFVESSGLLLLGGLLGWVQTTYHRWILANRPEVFAERMRQPALTKSGKPKRESGKNRSHPPDPHGLRVRIWLAWPCCCSDRPSRCCTVQSIPSRPASCLGQGFSGPSCSSGRRC